MTLHPRSPDPASAKWRQVRIPSANMRAMRAQSQFVAVQAWQRGKVRVISSIELAEAPDGTGDVIEQWHVSITRGGKLPRERDVDVTLRDFGIVDAEEDNHHPGYARHFWLPVEPSRRVDCECKEDEEVIVEPDGYTWTNPPDPSACRGCDFESLLGRPCPLHRRR